MLSDFGHRISDLKVGAQQQFELARRLYSEDAKRARNMAFRRQRRAAAPELAVAAY